MARKRTYYGVPIGILMLDTKFQRHNGDIGNAQTWPFPVQYKIVRGAVPNKVVDMLNNRDLLQRFLDAADELIDDGVDGITTTCGFLALFQQELAAHCSVPVATSALLQVPMVARVLPKGKRPAILTFSAESLTVHHLAGVGVDPQTPVVGMPATSEFQRSIRDGDASVPFRVLKEEVLGVAEAMIADDPSIGAIVCECTNLTPYSHEIKARLGVPVFDMVTLVHWFHRALRPERFAQP
ncbi:MAG TPA: aspartate/glutamate racemase family protein [Xanthobacteraceae bacterium]|nr:aspartate/glutamate racemase family protein [Xanthobacteraceae bacterium]